MSVRCHLALPLLLAALAAAPCFAQADDAAIVVDKDKRTVSVAARVAPRKLENLPDIYPLEVVATWPTPKGQKAHETVVTFDVKPSEVHQALEQLGLKPGAPAKGEAAAASGPELRLSLEVPGAGGVARRVPIERLMVDTKSGQAMPRVKWHFTGSALKQPDPDKADKVYGADLTGTLISIFPVTDDTVIQSALTMKDEPLLKLETDKRLVPKEGTAVRLIIEAL